MVAGTNAPEGAAGDPFTSSRSACSKAVSTPPPGKPGGGRFDDEVNTCSSPTPGFGAGSVQFSTYRRTFAVEFSKTGAASDRTAQKKPPTRARRPPRVR